MRPALAVVLCLVVVAMAAAAEDFDIGEVAESSFRELALLPTRLTYFNEHEDAAIASYTCCKARQEKQIQAALEANMAFLNHFAQTPYGDDTYMHYAWVSTHKPESFRKQEWGYRGVVQAYPDSSFADDAAWQLGNLYRKDYSHQAAIDVFEYLVDRWPTSIWADDALMGLLEEYKHVEDEQAALDVLNQLAYDYPKSEFCASALCKLAAKYMEAEDYPSAITVSMDLIRDFPYSDCADDAQFRIAHCYRLMGELQKAVEAYDVLVQDWHGSDLTNRAMREANNLLKRLHGNRAGTEIQLYDTKSWDPAKQAKELWHGQAKHYQNNGMHAMAISKFREFIDTFPGNDRWDDAWFEIGQTYLRQQFLFDEINKASGPEDLARLREDYTDSTGDSGAIPTDGGLTAIPQATEAFAHIANDLRGSPLQAKALGMVARCYTPYGKIDEGKVTTNAAYTHQEVVIHFPFSSVKLPYFTDGGLPVFSFCKLMKFYGNKDNWEAARQMYPQLSDAYPRVFPAGLEQNKDEFYELFKLYNEHVQFAYKEINHHIKYAMMPADLVPVADYYRAALLMRRGDYATAIDLLQPLTQLQGHDLVAPALYLYAQANIRLGNADTAKGAFDRLASEYKVCGLADDGHICWKQYQQVQQTPEEFDLTQPAQQLREKFGIEPANMDVFIGDGCVVFCPFTRAAKMRMYNMPNIWDESVRILRDWTDMADEDRMVIVVDRMCGSSRGNPFKVPGCQIKDPPKWSLGLETIAENVLRNSIPQLAKKPGLLSGVSKFSAASLQYDLVTETRDAIGSAAAVKLPQEDVMRARDSSLKALEEYIIDGSEGRITPQVVAGMMYSLLDSSGYSKSRLIDREPYRAFFAKLKELPKETDLKEAFAVALAATFGDECHQQLQDWRLPVTQTASTGSPTRVGMLP